MLVPIVEVTRGTRLGRVDRYEADPSEFGKTLALSNYRRYRRGTGMWIEVPHV